jgi:PRTRC genetic system protein B
MNALLHLGETATFELKQALLIYEARTGNGGNGGRAAGTTTAVTVHPVEGGVIRAGQAITYAAVESLASALGRNLAACYLPANVLSVSFGQVAWFCPAARRRLWFKVLADGNEKRLNGRFAQHPPLVFIASAHGLQAFAVVKNERPLGGNRFVAVCKI